ncbi:MAG: iron-sulfur cluster repair di-iron protein [Terriglobales bacterium]
MLDATKTVREFALEVPQATRLFEKLGIDYCCGGGKPLTEACLQANVPLDEVLQNLSHGTVEENESTNWKQANLSDLIDHIVTKHHGYVKQELPRLDSLMNKVTSKHGPKHPELSKMQELLAALDAELTSHLMKEEQVLFPYVVDCERTLRESGRVRPPMFGSVRNPIHMMELEHDSAGEVLKEMRAISNGFTAPEDGCFSFKTLYQGLMEFEADLHQHIHLENNILFPRAIDLESQGR